MAHTLILIQSYLFIISRSKVSFQFLIFKEGSYVVFTSTCHYFLSGLTFWNCKWDPLPLMVWSYSSGRKELLLLLLLLLLYLRCKMRSRFKQGIWRTFVHLFEFADDLWLQVNLFSVDMRRTRNLLEYMANLRCHCSVHKTLDTTNHEAIYAIGPGSSSSLSGPAERT